MLKVFRFDSQTYLELKEDKNATGQAVAALFLACLGRGIGNSLQPPLAIDLVLVGILAGLILSLVAGLLWSITAFLVGTKLFQGKAQFWQLARPLFFSASPGIFFVLTATPVSLVSAATGAIVATWIIVGGVIALKNAMGFSYNRSMLTYIVGFLIGIAVAGFLGLGL